MIVSIQDFIAGGKFELHTGMYDQAKLIEYIDRYEPQYLRQLLGVDLYNEFEADLILGAGVPTETRFLVIFDELNFDYSYCIYQSKGMKDILLGFIYFEYVRDLDNQMTSIGNVLPKGENSDRVTSLDTRMWERYNESIKSYQAIQKYICRNTESYDYDKFNGRHKQTAYWI